MAEYRFLKMTQTEITLQLIQLVALILPANVILLQVLAKVFEEPYSLEYQEYVESKKGGFQTMNELQTDLTLRSNTDRWQFYGPKASIHLFVWAGLFFIFSLLALEYLSIFPLAAEWIQILGIVLLLAGFILMGAPLIAVEPTVADAIPKFLSSVKEVAQWITENENSDVDDKRN